jgi:hypothetical protein
VPEAVILGAPYEARTYRSAAEADAFVSPVHRGSTSGRSRTQLAGRNARMDAILVEIARLSLTGKSHYLSILRTLILFGWQA